VLVDLLVCLCPVMQWSRHKSFNFAMIVI
jgi:hypothetical protein